MSLFGKSAVEKRTGALTDETLPEFDLAGGLAYADDINRSADHGKDSLRHLVKRLKVKNGHVQMLALTLLDVCCKNCNSAFHALLAGKEPLGQLAEMAVHRRTPAAVRDYALTLIETWSEAFGGGASGRPGEPQLSAFTDTYRRLKNSGVEFPARDMQALAPVQTPMRNAGVVGGVNRMAQQQQMQRRGGAAPINPYGAPNDWQQQPYGEYPPAQMPPPQPQAHQPPQLYTYPPPILPLANPAYPQHQQPQQPQYPVQPAHPAAPPRPSLTPAQQRDYEQWTALCPSFVAKVQRETLLVLEHALLLRDLCSASGSPAELQRDPLAGQLAGALSEARNRYTKLILSAGDEQSPEAQPHAEFVIDLSIRMIDVVRGVLEFHAARAEGRSAPLPDISVPREMTEGQGQRQQQPQQSPQRSPPSSAGGGSGGASAPRTQHLFDMPADASEEDEKRMAAAVFAQSRVARSPLPSVSAAALASSSVNGSAAAAAAATPSTDPVSPPYVSPPPDSFTPAQSFSAAESFGHHSDAHRPPTSRYALPAASSAGAASAGWSSGPSFGSSASAAHSDSSSAAAGQSGQSDQLGVGDVSQRNGGGSTPTPFDDLLQSGGGGGGSGFGSAGAATPVDRSYAGRPHRTRAQEEADRESARRESERLARQQEDAARAFDLLMPMRAFDGHAPGQSGLRHVGEPNAALAAAAAATGGGDGDPSAERDPGALSPGGPAASPTHSQPQQPQQPQSVADADDAFLADMAALTLPQQRAESKEGED